MKALALGLLAALLVAQNFAPQNCVYDPKLVKWVCADASQGSHQDVQSDGGSGSTGDAGSGDAGSK